MKYLESKKRFLLSHASKAYYYVSLGDSIAAGHTIDENWATNYGEESQYFVNGNTETELVPNSYTHRMLKYLENVYGDRVSCTSFARSGARVERNGKDDSRSLIHRLDDEGVRDAIGRANLVTICIGANDILEEAIYQLSTYITSGNLDDFRAIVNTNFAKLRGDIDGTSYRDLFTKLNGINPNAKYVFTTVYNPYKYLHIASGTKENEYGDGFLGPVFKQFPQITLGIELDKLVKKKIVESEAVSTVLERVNGLAPAVDDFVNGLNDIIKDSIKNYQAEGHYNFIVADTKALFDSIPNRGKPYSDNLHYNDLVSVEFTEGFNVAEADWGALWRGNVINDTVCNDAETFWKALLKKYNCLNPFDTEVGNWDDFVNEFITQTVAKVIVPDVDPHPEYDGHYLLFRSFADALGYIPLKTITYNANGGTGEAYTQKVIDTSLGANDIPTTVYSILTPNRFTPQTGYYHTGWGRSNGQTYIDGETIRVDGNLLLNAQWSNMYKLVYRHSRDVSIAYLQGSDQTGPMECYELWVAGTENNKAEKPEAKLGEFYNEPKVYTLPYGTAIGIVVKTEFGTGSSYIKFNDKVVSGKSKTETFDFTLTTHTDINFEWNRRSLISYWNCYITTL